MSIDSSANLLFKIGADSSDAQATMQQFRSILSKDLAVMGEGFSNWANNVFGDLSTFKGMMLGVTAAAGTALVGMAAAMHSAAQKTAEFAGEIEDGMDKTGLAAGEMSRLRFAAERTGLGYEELVSSLVKFQRGVVTAASDTDKHAQTFGRLGISQQEVKMGAESILPLLLKTADAFKSQSSTVEKSASSMQLFGRGGADLLEFLSLGSDGIQQFGDRAAELGRVIDEKTVTAAKALGIAMQELRAETEAMEFAIGKATLPLERFWASTKIGAFEMVKNWQGDGPMSPTFWMGLALEVGKADARIQSATQTAIAAGGKNRLGPTSSDSDKGSSVQKSKQDFEGLSNALAQARSELAQFGSEEERVAFETSRMESETTKAVIGLDALHQAGKITSDVFRREMAAWAEMPAAIAALAAAQTAKLEQARAEATVKATEELQSRLAGMEEQTYTNRQAAFTREIAARRANLDIKGNLSKEATGLLVAIETAGLRQIDKEQSAAFVKELQDLQGHLAATLTAHMTQAEALRFQYEQDAERFSAAQEAMSVSTYKEEAQREAIRQQFALNRKASLEAYLGDLNALRDSSGWQGVFGDAFADAIRGNEELLREWANSANQSLLMVQVAGQSVTESLQRGFNTFSQAMGANIAQAIVYKTSIGEAMRAAAASALQSIAAESIVQAIYSTALGFLRLAHHDYPGATAAFQAAAIFGSVGTVAAVAGRAIAPQQAGAGASGGGGGASVSSGGGAGSSGGSGGSQGPTVAIYVSGPIVGVSGIEELTAMINDAVKDRDVKLYATAVRETTRVII